MKELADFPKLPPREQKKIMKKVIAGACAMQRETLRKAELINLKK